MLGECLVGIQDPPSRPSALLQANHLDLRVLEPAAYYSRYNLKHVETAFDVGVRALGQRRGVTLTFAYEVLVEKIKPEILPDALTLLCVLDNSRRLHPV